MSIVQAWVRAFCTVPAVTFVSLCCVFLPVLRIFLCLSNMASRPCFSSILHHIPSQAPASVKSDPPFSRMTDITMNVRNASMLKIVPKKGMNLDPSTPFQETPSDRDQKALNRATLRWCW